MDSLRSFEFHKLRENEEAMKQESETGERRAA
jgi:hypothetical protein